MAVNSSPPPHEPALDVAREMLRQHGPRRILPSPEAYRQAYHEITGSPSAAIPGDSAYMLLNRILSPGITSLLHDEPELAAEAILLAEEVVSTENRPNTDDFASRLTEFCQKIEIKGSSSARQQEMLLRMFRLVLNNVGKLLDDNTLAKSQIEAIEEMISRPLSISMLDDLEAELSDVIGRQSQLNSHLREARESVRELKISLLERLDQMTSGTGSYHGRIRALSEKVHGAGKANGLGELLESVRTETRMIQEEFFASLGRNSSSVSDIADARVRIQLLEHQLEKISELVCEDMLTGSLNRRGMEKAMAREIARANRSGEALSVAFLDLDDFRLINDRYGHLAGDDALVHLVRIARQTLRASDFIARYGGDEFLLIFPETTEYQSISILQRMQNELTRQIFMYKQKQIPLTFSAGTSRHAKDESWETVTNRANKAMHAAKKKGKNRVSVYDSTLVLPLNIL